jgi:hypothetical protein
VTFARDLDALIERHLAAGDERVLVLIDVLTRGIRKLCADESGPRCIDEED